MKKIAIIGTGISGLGAAYLLYRDYDITVYEKDATLGGHSRTLEVEADGVRVPVDTGFIVFNYRTYPHLTGLFKHLDVPVAKSDMSLGLSLESGKFEWGCAGLNAVFGQRSNALKPRFWGMIHDILRFNRLAVEYVQTHPNLTLGELLKHLKMGEDFRHRFLLPTAGAVWSSSPEQILDFPATSFVTFFDNHGLLSVNDQPQWWTVDGGSREYVKRVSAPFADRIRLASPVASILRYESHVEVTTVYGQSDRYDGVVLATHSDQALKLLHDASAEEREVLGAIPYQNNRAFLHRDPALMPKRKACWASWNYLSDSAVDDRTRIIVTYWMNRLQPSHIPQAHPLFVTLNPHIPPRPELVLDEHMFEHPVYSLEMIAAQTRIPSIQGKRRTWFCGAYQRYGFHEDGLWSAVRVAEMLGCEVVW
jgi:predicted NAD/FAD-binding protein